jgi:hypothetical protein
MRPFKIFGGLLFGASAMMLITSCTKNMDEQTPKGDREVGQFSSSPCGPFIGLIGTSTVGYFYVGDPSAAAERQIFSGTNFTDDRYFKVTGVNGNAFYTGAPLRHIGVDDQWVNAGEALWLELGSAFTTQKMQGFDLIVQGEGTGAGGATPSTGMVEIYDGMTLLKTFPLSQTTNVKLSYVAAHNEPKFDRIKLTTTAGKLAISGRFPAQTGLGQAKFYLVPDESTFVFMQIATGQTLIGATNYDNWFINYRELGINRPQSDRQNRAMGTSLAPGSGEFPANNPGKQWLNISAGQGNTMVARYDNERIGVNDQWINNSDVVTITPGADFPTGSFRSFEVREAVLDGGKMVVKLWNGMTEVGGGMTTGVDGTFNTFVATEDFDRVTITPADPSKKPSIGRITPVGFAIRVYPGCN